MTTNWKRILCAVDFSEPSRLAMLDAAALARATGAALELLHVYEPPRGSMVATDMLAPAPREVEEQLREELARTLEPWRQEAAAIAGGAIAELLPGLPAEEIVAVATERRADLVVLATHGRRGLARAVMGSVAERVVREAPCSVLVARKY